MDACGVSASAPMTKSHQHSRGKRQIPSSSAAESLTTRFPTIASRLKSPVSRFRSKIGRNGIKK